MRSRVEFRLTMPGRSSWNGRWSGEEKNYTIVRTLSSKTISQLFAIVGSSERWLCVKRSCGEVYKHNPLSCLSCGSDVARMVADLTATKSWSHRWSDGWCAQVTGRIVRTGERLKKSDSFNGYDWMVDRIIDHGDTYERGPDGKVLYV